MQLQLATGALGVAAVLGTLALLPQRGQPPRPVQPPEPRGHLILLIEGDARGLRVTHVTAKTDPYNPVHGKTSHQIAVYDRNRQVLGRYPLDLSRFDLDPANAGRPRRVQGCEVIDTRVVALANIPWLPNADFLEIEKGVEKGAVSVGGLAAADYGRLVLAAEQVLERQR